MDSRVNKYALKRVTAWMFYLLGVTDGISASLETFKGLNPEPLNDAEWRTTLRSYLPSELAALRQPHSNLEPAARIIQQEFTEAFPKTRRQRQKHGK